MNIDPSTGLDLDDPEVKAMRAATPAPASPMLAMDIPRTGGVPAGIPGPGSDQSAPPLQTESAPAPLAPPPPAPGGPPPGLAPPVIPSRPTNTTPLGAPGLTAPSLTGGGPTKSVTDQEKTTSSTRQVIGKEEQKAEADYQKTLGDQSKVIKDAGAIEQEKARAEQDAAAKKEAILQENQGKFKGIIDGANTEYARAEANVQAAEKAYKEAKPEGLFADDKYGLRRFFAGVAMALGGYNAGVNGGPNQGYVMIKDAIDRKDRMERERIGKLKEGADEARGQLSVVLGKKHEALGDLAAWKAAAWDTAAAQLQTRLAAQGMPAAQVQTDARVLQAKAEAQKERQTFLQGTRQSITNQVQTKTQQIVGGATGTKAADKPLSEWKPEERKAEGFAMRAYKANQEMESSAYSPKDLEVLRNDALLQAKGGLTEAGVQRLIGSTYQRLSPTGKKRFNATKEFITSALRPESGAVIGPSEIADAEQRYGTQSGDTPDAARQKKAFRANKIAEVGLQTGRPGFWMETTGAYGGGQQGGAPSQQGVAKPQEDKGRPFRHPDGRMGRLLANGTFIADAGQQVASR